MLNQLSIVVIILCCSVTAIIAQEPPKDSALNAPADTRAPADRPLPKQIAGGILNGKASSLPKPSYPDAARSVKASGSVAVKVLIDEAGNVISAEALSGHPLLRPPSVEAALSAKFSPTMLSGQPVKVSGIITYNFVLESGAMLGDSGLRAEIPVSDANKIWAVGMLFSLIQAADLESIRMLGDEKEFNSMLKELSTDLSSEMAGYKPSLEKLSSSDLTTRAEAAREFLRMVRKEFNKEQNWQIDVGEQIGFVIAELLRQKLLYVKTGTAYDANVIRTHLSRLSDLISTSPAGVSAATKSKFQRIAAFADATDLGTDVRFSEMLDAIEPLFAEFKDY